MTYPITTKAMRLSRAKVEVYDRLMTEKVEAIRARKPFDHTPYFTTKRADYTGAELRMAALSLQDDDPVIRNYRIVGAAPNFAEIEQLVRWIARRYGHDESELFGDVMDSIVEDTEWPIPTEARHLKARFMRRAYLISTTGKYRKSRIKSKLTLPLSTLERQENSPSYNPYIGEKGQSLPTFSADRVHYVGHKAPGLPETNAFAKSGRIDQYLTDKGLDSLSNRLVASVRYLPNRGGPKGHHYAIVWTKLAREFGCNTRTLVNEFRQNVRDLIAGIDSERKPIQVWVHDHYETRNKSHPGNAYGRNNYVWTAHKGRWVTSAFRPIWDDIICEVNRPVVTAEWRVSHTKKEQIIDHYREHRNPDNCRICDRIETDITRAAITNRTLLKAYLAN